MKKKLCVVQVAKYQEYIDDPISCLPYKINLIKYPKKYIAIKRFTKKGVIYEILSKIET